MSAFVDIFGDIVAAVRAEYDVANGKRPFYLHGHIIEIVGILAEKDQSETYKYDKYPLIVLVQDFEEVNDKGSNSVKGLTIIIMTETDPNYTAKNRYDNTFPDTLQPLYESLIDKIEISKDVGSDDLYSHSKWDRLYYGSEDQLLNIGNDALDAIVIQNLDLSVFNLC